MNRVKTISVMILLVVLAGCGENKQSNDDLIVVDVLKSYPKKELILQDFMDVEYIPLEISDEFVCQGWVQDISKDILIVRNNMNDGDIFVFDRKTGKGIQKINRKGQGNEEYTGMSKIVVDEDDHEIYVNNHTARKIMVYDIEGNFQRSLKQNDDLYFFSIFNFDRENLICNNHNVIDKSPFRIVSKQHGSLIKDITIPFEEKKSIYVTIRDEATNMINVTSPGTYNPIIQNFGTWVLVDYSADTIYSYLPDHTMKPFILRTPSIESMDPEVFLFLNTITDRYYFMESVKIEYDFNKDDGFPATDLLYDKIEKSIFEYTVYNDDYANKKNVNMKSSSINNEIAVWQRIEAFELVEAYEKGELKDGKLKEIASKMDAEDNPVIMLIKHKKK